MFQTKVVVEIKTKNFIFDVISTVHRR